MEFWLGVTIAAVAGFALGAVVVWLVDRKRGGGTSVATLKQEHEQFREQVTSHFVETADLINKLTDSYKDVFDHLSKGAETLIDDKSLRDRMPQVSDQEVRLKRIGSRSGSAGTETQSKSASEAAKTAAPKTSSTSSSRANADAAKPVGEDSKGGSRAASSGERTRSGTSSEGGEGKHSSSKQEKDKQEKDKQETDVRKPSDSAAPKSGSGRSSGHATAPTARQPSKGGTAGSASGDSPREQATRKPPAKT